MKTNSKTTVEGVALRALEAGIADKRATAMQYAVADARGLRWSLSAGRLDVGGSAVQDDSIFLLASVAKLFTAILILQLAEEGRLLLEEPISNKLSFPLTSPDDARPTIGQTLAHRGGFPNPAPLDWLHLELEHPSFDERAALAKVMQDHPDLRHPPGERYAYSNPGYWLLGNVIQTAGGKSYCEALRERIVARLDIPEDELGCAMPSAQRRAVGLERAWTARGLVVRAITKSRFRLESKGGWMRFAPLYMNGPAYGGVFGSARAVAVALGDLLRERPRLLSAASRDLLLGRRSGILDGATPGGLRAGTLNLRTNRTGTRIAMPHAEKAGGGPGFAANARIYFEAGVATAYTMNRMAISEGEVHAFSDQVDRAWLGRSEALGD